MKYCYVLAKYDNFVYENWWIVRCLFNLKVAKDDDSDLIAPERREHPLINRNPRMQASPANAEKKAINKLGQSNGAAVDIKCNTKALRYVIQSNNSPVSKRIVQVNILILLVLQNIGDNSSVSKRAINDRAEAKFGGSIDVICSKGHFSYVYSSNLYCEATKGDITCIAFRQSH
ncbi:unnamed protein product [Gongylonema pulchrum]|uniref:Ground-like domain-containing protein n=1 Tax=Gongylonema pulchrum TaxID=637853 RepID=A0A183DGW1_9BILA|nr:unnamed protein product [Gongylonema pulchrum]